MRYMLLRFLSLFIVVSMMASTRADDKFAIPGGAAEVLQQRCTDCHSDDLAEGDVRLDALADLDLEARLDLLNRAQEQLFLHRMPPEDEAQPPRGHAS